VFIDEDTQSPKSFDEQFVSDSRVERCTYGRHIEKCKCDHHIEMCESHRAELIREYTQKIDESTLVASEYKNKCEHFEKRAKELELKLEEFRNVGDRSMVHDGRIRDEKSENEPRRKCSPNEKECVLGGWDEELGRQVSQVRKSDSPSSKGKSGEEYVDVSKEIEENKLEEADRTIKKKDLEIASLFNAVTMKDKGT
ncbi:17589_t:CDS:1, partial [Acaulospora colombiana]